MEISNNIKWMYVLMASALFVLAQGSAWLQHNLQFKYPKLGPEWWGWYLAAIPITWLFLKSTQLGVQGFGNSLWANRFLEFSIGIIVYAILTQYLFNQPMTSKIWVQVGLCVVIICVQVLWKEPIN